MNRKLIFSVVGKLLQFLAAILLLPTVVCLIYAEITPFVAFAITIGISFVAGFVLRLINKPTSRVIYAREGFLIVSLAWFLMSLIGALPFFISGEIPSYADAFFETVSGFTTTGASILTNVEAMSHGLLFWRSFTHWIGGMGVLVFVMSLLSNIADRSIHIMRAEMPGPIVGKIVPRVRDTSKILYIMYIILTIIQIAFLLAGGMPLFDSVVHTFGTAGTGGFGIRSDSIASYSPYLQWVIGIFLVLFGINFNLYYLMLIKRFKTAIKSAELWTYIGIIAASTVLITVNIMPFYSDIEETVRTAFFQVSSIMTTAGFSTADFNLWPSFSKSILLILMFIGACAGSTGGGLKVSRVVIIFKMVAAEFRRLIHPRSVSAVKYEGKELDENTKHGVTAYFAVYMICLLGIFLLLSLDKFDFETNFSAVVACFNNVGPGFGVVGPMGSYAEYSVLSKIVLSFAMLIGRLEIFPIFIALIPSTWRKK